ncbi:glutathione S-transferase N-terminal domain-containing protein [Candidatus Woesearchaeota archaeon]|nr:glutathione S-transferase N-terminal domain-containing protein [Candidatus Woesearchaeota archaeon]
MKEHKVVLYTTPTCSWCHKTREFLKQHKIKFEDIDVSKDYSAAMKMIKKSGQQGVPVIDIDGNIVVGFDEPKLRRILKIAS